MIFLDLVGGGGSANEASLCCSLAADDRRRGLTAATGGVGFETFRKGKRPVGRLADEPFAFREKRCKSCIAGGGSSKGRWRGGAW